MFSTIFTRKTPDINGMKEKGDIRGLIRALRIPDADIQIQAGMALGALGPGAVDALIQALATKNKTHKLGIIGALSEIRSPRAVPRLIGTLDDENSEVRWQAAVALGEIGDGAAIEPLRQALRDPDKYVRYGAAISLTKLGWKPPDQTERAFYFAGLQEWMAVREVGKPAVPAVTALLKDRDSTVRIKAIEILGSIGDPDGTPAIMKSLGDENRDVRWACVLSAPKCGISMLHLPRGLAHRPQNMKNPYIAGFLNFILPGLGYGYLGKWWGVMIFQIDISATVWLYRSEGDANTYLILLPIYVILALHAWYITTKMPKDPP